MMEIDQFIKDSILELRKGASKKGHPFRTFTLSTSNGIQPFARTVVFRRFSQDNKITFYSDSRSQKLTHLQTKPLVSCLFYHQRKQLQIEMLCETRWEELPDSDVFKLFPEKVQKDYSTTLPPGTPIESRSEIAYTQNSNFFTEVHCFGYQLNILQLDKEQHLRASAKWENDQWNATWLVP